MTPVRHRRSARTLCLLMGAVLMVAMTGGLATAAAGVSGPTRPASSTGIAHWRMVGSYVKNSLYAGEGLATVTQNGHRHLLYRGILSVPQAESAEGWTHIGDPDATGGYVIDAYQGPSSRPSKMFLVTRPSGATVQYVHKLVPGELYNNSFDAIAPGAQWMVAGEWGTMIHLQTYRAPLLNHETSSRGGSLKLAGYIKLDHKVYDIQGCDFVTATTLICVSDDDRRKLFTNQKPLLEVVLAHALNGRNVAGHVIDLGSIPQKSTCTGTFEAEGIDYDVATGILRVEIVQPGSCVIHTTVYQYAKSR